MIELKDTCFFDVIEIKINDEGYDEFGAYYGSGYNVFELEATIPSHWHKSASFYWNDTSDNNQIRVNNLCDARKYFVNEVKEFHKYVKYHTCNKT